MRNKPGEIQKLSHPMCRFQKSSVCVAYIPAFLNRVMESIKIHYDIIHITMDCNHTVLDFLFADALIAYY